MAGAVPYIAQGPSVAASGTSLEVECSGFIQGPVAQISISNAANVRTQQSFDRVTWITLITSTASEGIELDPRGVYFRWIWDTNSGTIGVVVGPGLTEQGMSNVKGAAVKTVAPV